MTSLNDLVKQPLISQDLISAEQAAMLTPQQRINLAKYYHLISQEIFTLDEIIALSPRQHSNLNKLYDLVANSDYHSPPEAEISRSVPGDFYICYSRWNNEAVLAERIAIMFRRGYLGKEAMLNFSLDYKKLDTRICALIVNGKMSPEAALILTDHQKTCLQNTAIFNLLLTDVVTLDEVFSLTEMQCLFLAETPAIYQHIKARELALADIPELEFIFSDVESITHEEAKYYLNANLTAIKQLDLDPEELVFDIWNNIKIKVQERIWSQLQAFYFSPQDEKFLELLEFGEKSLNKYHLHQELLADRQSNTRPYNGGRFFTNSSVKPATIDQPQSHFHFATTDLFVCGDIS